MTPQTQAALTTQPPVVATMVLYFVAVAGIAWWATRRTRSVRDFFVAGGTIGLFPMAMAAMAASLSGFAFIGGPGLVYTVGIGAVYVLLPLSLTTSMTAWLLAGKLRALADSHGAYTIPDAIGIRYQSPAAQGLAGVALLVAVIGYLATNFLALGVVLGAVLGVSVTTGVWIGALVTLAYSVSGGALAGVYTDVLQGSVMAVASILVFALAMSAGAGTEGFAATIVPADPAFLGPFGKLTPMAALSLFFVFGIGALGQPHVLHKFYMLKDPARLRWYPMVMTIAMSLTVLLFVGVGLAVKALVVRGEMPPLGRADDATPAFLTQYAPSWLAGLVFAGVAAAIMSSVNAFLSIGAAAVTHDIPRALGRTVRDELRWGRLSTLVISLLAAAVASRSQAMVAFLGIFGYGLFASTLVPALAIGLSWPGATRAGAIASIGTGLAVSLVMESLAYMRVFTFPAGVTATALALVSSLLVFLVVSRLTPGTGGRTETRSRSKQ